MAYGAGSWAKVKASGGVIHLIEDAVGLMSLAAFEATHKLSWEARREFPKTDPAMILDEAQTQQPRSLLEIRWNDR